jgi:hypothetical protein
MPNNTTQTTAVAVTLTLNSSDTQRTPPYNVTQIACAVTTQTGNQPPATNTIYGWTLENIPPPQPQGAAFTLSVVDSSFSTNATAIVNWALTFIPRPGTTVASPFDNNKNTIVGSGSQAGQGGNGTFVLESNTIKNQGTFDWIFMVQIQIGSNIFTFASDPEMEVGSN